MSDIIHIKVTSKPLCINNRITGITNDSSVVSIVVITQIFFFMIPFRSYLTTYLKYVNTGKLTDSLSTMYVNNSTEIVNTPIIPHCDRSLI